MQKVGPGSPPQPLLTRRGSAIPALWFVFRAFFGRFSTVFRAFFECFWLFFRLFFE